MIVVECLFCQTDHVLYRRSLDEESKLAAEPPNEVDLTHWEEGFKEEVQTVGNVKYANTDEKGAKITTKQKEKIPSKTEIKLIFILVNPFLGAGSLSQTTVSGIERSKRYSEEERKNCMKKEKPCLSCDTAIIVLFC